VQGMVVGARHTCQAGMWIGAGEEVPGHDVVQVYRNCLRCPGRESCGVVLTVVGGLDGVPV
jgi:hypothetical protein